MNQEKPETGKAAPPPPARPVVAAPRHPALIAEQGILKYGKEEYELLGRLNALLDARLHGLRQQYLEMMGVVRMSSAEEDKKLQENRAYQHAVATLEGDKRLLQEIYDRLSHSRSVEARMKLRRERIKRLKDAVRRRAEEKRREYENKKRLYDAKFDEVESTAYAKGADRIEEDRKRYEALAAELEKKLQEETVAIACTQKAMEQVDRDREILNRMITDSRKALEDAMATLRTLLARLLPPERDPDA